MTEIVHLDLKDRKILYELDTDARQTYLQIAKSVGLSKDVVIYRINRLIEKGVIRRFYAVLDPSKLGYFTVRVYLKFQNISSEKEKEMINYISQLNNVRNLARIEGDWNFVFMLWVKTHEDFDKTWLAFEKKFRPHIQRKEIAIITEEYRFRRHHFYEGKQLKHLVDVTGLSKPEKLDKIDLQLLELLYRSARCSLIELANKIKLTSKAVSYRIKQLEQKKIIVRYRAALNLDALGYHHYKVNVNLEKLEELTALNTFIKSNQYIVKSLRSIGGSDFEFNVECPGFNEFLNILTKMKEQFGESIRDYSYHLALDLHKTQHFPGDINIKN
ncbi:hypothetical protein COV18_04590 [Candidatus Woesearchaeota archaeon CG10_big_fil_rev_8_21_14_0_10_37_12]|nr:MAG: hypothetical protein COV18_04590 [Candidatus Woesearchaeota archaeon CG10_big_fil_rev_8_21_14_0_10_37_12]